MASASRYSGTRKFECTGCRGNSNSVLVSETSRFRRCEKISRGLSDSRWAAGRMGRRVVLPVESSTVGSAGLDYCDVPPRSWPFSARSVGFGLSTKLWLPSGGPLHAAGGLCAAIHGTSRAGRRQSRDHLRDGADCWIVRGGRTLYGVLCSQRTDLW